MSRTFALFALLAACICLCFAPRAAAQTSTAKPPVHHHAVSHTGTDPALYHPATLHARAPAVFQVKFVTTKGDFVIQATRDWAPNGVDRFYNLVRHGYFTGVSFYRVVPGFIVQFGLSPIPRLNSIWSAATIKDDPVKESNKAGYVTYAMGGPNSRTTQLFINFGDNSSQLDSMGFAPIGQVVSGLEVVRQLYSGYGELSDLGGTGPSQARVNAAGKAYLDANYPKLDSIKSATIVSPEAPAHKPAAHHVTHHAAPSKSAS